MAMDAGLHKPVSAEVLGFDSFFVLRIRDKEGNIINLFIRDGASINQARHIAGDLNKIFQSQKETIYA
jgi:hypothetical protein